MKVTAKKPLVGGEHKVVEEGERFYIVYGDTIGSYKALPKSEYEPVQEWVDVTKECEAILIENTYRIYRRVNGGGCRWIGDQFGYRVTNADNLSRIKVEVKQ